MKVYKLTDAADKTRGATQWGEGVTHAVEDDIELCKSGIHAYSHPLLAVLHAPIHGALDLATAHLWECSASAEHIDDNGTKSVHRSLTTLRRVDVPAVTVTQCVAYGILCAREVCLDSVWLFWADRWLAGEDCSREAARVAAREAENAARAATWAAAARAAAWAARATRATRARAEMMAASAAREASAATNGKLDLVALAKKAMEF